jgi:hypothetical protein
VRAFCLSDPSDRFMSFESFVTDVRALECALRSFTSSLLYSLRVLVAFFAIFMLSELVGKPRR